MSRSRRRSRDADATIVFGLHAVQSVLEHNPQRMLSLSVDSARLARQERRLIELTGDAAAAGIAIERVRADTLDRLCDGARHQGAVARVRPAAALGEDELEQLLGDLAGAPLLLVLDGVTDPHNLGACLRAGAAAGVDAVVVPRDRAAGDSAGMRKVASGAAETVPLVRVTNLARTLRALGERGLLRIGADAGAETLLYDCDLRGGLALVMGGEESGLRRLTREHCDRLAALPMGGGVESLNVAVTAGICLFEAVRQRRTGG